MKRAHVLTVVTLLLLASSTQAQPPWWGGQPVPNLNGPWYMNGNPEAICQIFQGDTDGRAMFINEQGSRARGIIQGDRVWIPGWSDGRGSVGLEGRIRGDRIVWPNGTFWARGYFR